MLELPGGVQPPQLSRLTPLALVRGGLQDLSWPPCCFRQFEHWLRVNHGVRIDGECTPILRCSRIWLGTTWFDRRRCSRLLIVRAGVCLYVSLCNREVLLPSRWSHNFHYWLIWKVISSTLRWYDICWGIIWSWPVIWARKWPLRQKSRFPAVFCQTFRKLIEIYKSLQWAAIRKMGLGFLTTPKLATQLDPFPLFGGWKHIS